MPKRQKSLFPTAAEFRDFLILGAGNTAVGLWTYIFLAGIVDAIHGGKALN
jgi:hypothetical protein